MTEDVEEIFAVVAEFNNEAPILMECEGENSSRDKATEHMKLLLGSGRVVRACVVRLTYEAGNKLLLHDMKRMQG